MNKIDFSIIVPVYNCECTIKRCLNSILAQDFANYEVITIDDGSTDNSGKICDRYSLLDSRIRSIHTSNRGVSAARYLGVKESRGNYICFIDSDDEFDKSMLETVYEVVSKNSCDLLIFGMQKIFTNNNKIIFKESDNCINEYWLTKDKIMCNVIKLFPNMIIASLCNKVYKRELIFGEKMVEKSTGEDYLFNLKILSKASSVICINQILYNYYRPLDKETRANKNDFSLLDDFILMHKTTYDLFFNIWSIRSEKDEYQLIIDTMMYGLYQMIIFEKIKHNDSDKILKKYLHNKWILRSIKNSETNSIMEKVYKLMLKNNMFFLIRLFIYMKGRIK